MKSVLRSVVSLGAVAAVFGAAGAVQADMISNAGFETMVSTTGTLPNGYGYWRGDMSTIVGTENDILPFEGICMLRFDNTTRNGASGAVGAEIWQIIDVSSYESMIRSGNGQIDAGAYFNRVNQSFGSAVDTMFSIGVYAYAGSADTFPSQWTHNELGSSQSAFASDGDLQSWQQASLSFLLPQATDFVVLRLSATENIFNDVSGAEFAGHYVDGVGFTIIPTPASLLCLAPAGLLALGRRRRHA